MAVIRDRSDVLFSNMEEILDFHRNTFLQQLEKYTSNPEDVGHCFVTWVRVSHSLHGQVNVWCCH